MAPFRLLAFKISETFGLGIGGEVRELVGAVPLADVDSFHVTRLPLGQVITVTVRGVPIKLEANALACGKRLAETAGRLDAGPLSR